MKNFTPFLALLACFPLAAMEKTLSQSKEIVATYGELVPDGDQVNFLFLEPSTAMKEMLDDLGKKIGKQIIFATNRETLENADKAIFFWAFKFPRFGPDVVQVLIPMQHYAQNVREKYVVTLQYAFTRDEAIDIARKIDTEPLTFNYTQKLGFNFVGSYRGNNGLFDIEHNAQRLEKLAEILKK